MLKLFKQYKCLVFCSLCDIISTWLKRVSLYWPTQYKDSNNLLRAKRWSAAYANEATWVIRHRCHVTRCRHCTMLSPDNSTAAEWRWALSRDPFSDAWLTLMDFDAFWCAAAAATVCLVISLRPRPSHAADTCSCVFCMMRNPPSLKWRYLSSND